MRRTKWRHSQIANRIHVANGRWLGTASANFRSGSSWTTSRVLLFSGFASSLTYLYGVTDAGAHIEGLWKKDRLPAYGSVKDLNEVRGSVDRGRRLPIEG